MIDTLTSANHQDFRARYQGTIGWFLGEQNKKILVYVAATGRDRVAFKDVKGAEYYAIADQGIKFEFIPVDRGFFNTNTSLLYMERVPERQWHRGICSNNTRVYNCMKAAHFMSIPVNLVTLQGAFVDPPSVETAVKSLLDGKRYASALSKHFAIIGEDVYFFMARIGSHKAGVIKLDNPMVFQELCDVVKRKNLPLQVTK